MRVLDEDRDAFPEFRLQIFIAFDALLEAAPERGTKRDLNHSCASISFNSSIEFENLGFRSFSSSWLRL